jgi:hypothetical protein
VKQVKGLFPICVLASLLVLPSLAQDSLQPFTKSYVDITIEQAWIATAKAAREVSDVATNVTRKIDIPKEQVEFAKYHAGFPLGKGVRFKASVTRTFDGRVQITATPTKVAGASLPGKEEIESLANQFFSLLDREVGVYWSNATNQNGTTSPFASFRRSLIGVNVVARTALPVWLEPNGDIAFPTAHSQTKPDERLTITNLLLCSRYPVGEVGSECGAEVIGNRKVVAVLFNGAQPRLLSSLRPVQAGSAAAAFGNALDSLVCVFGNAVGCVQANQRMSLRELERLQATMQQSSAEASWSMGELLKFQQTGPEIVFELFDEELSPGADFSTAIQRRLSRFIEMSSLDISHPIAHSGKETRDSGSGPEKVPQEEMGKLAVSTVPENAEIFVDEAMVGTSAATLRLKAGEHTVRVVLSDYKEWARKITVLPGSESKLVAVLEKQKYSIH